MKHKGMPILDPRDAEQVLNELLARRPAYVPELSPAVGGPAQALLQIFARYMEVVIDRLNQAPDKNLLAFLDMLGISLIPAQAARAPVVFEPLPNAGDGRITAHTRLGAQVPDLPDPLMFETERTIALAATRLVEVKTLWPSRDEYADHTVEFAGGRAFTLFNPLRPVPHEFYLAHDTLFAFAGEATVEIEFELATPGSEPLEIAWEFWDGQVWRSFKPIDPDNVSASQDGTEGLTRSGVVRLRAECGQSKKTKANGTNAYWVRGRLGKLLAPNPTQVLPLVDRIRMRSAVVRPACAAIITQQEIVGDFAITGIFKDEDRTPLSGVEVILFGPGLEDLLMRTDEGGKAIFPAEPNRSYFMGVIDRSQPTVIGEVRAGISAIRAEFIVIPGLQPDRAFADGLQVDVSKTFYPFGQQPQPGSTFYFSNNEIFTKPGATMTVCLKLVPRQDSKVTDVSNPEVAWEYWNGHRWVRLSLKKLDPLSALDNEEPTLFTDDGLFSLQVPTNMTPVEVNGQEARWMRARLTNGNYRVQRDIVFENVIENNGGQNSKVTVEEPNPPTIGDMRLGYSYRSTWEQPDHCLTHNDFQFKIHSRDVRVPGGFFPPFRPVPDVTPALYLGFDRPLPNDFVSLYLDIEERDRVPPPLVWEAWDGIRWRELSVTDGTDGLQRPGMVSFIAPEVAPRPETPVTQASGNQINLTDELGGALFKSGDQVLVKQDKRQEMVIIHQIKGNTILLATPLSETFTGGSVAVAALPRFGVPRDWVRVRLKADGAPTKSRIQGIHLNAAWAVQVQSLNDEVLGSGTGQPNQSLFFSQAPVLPGERIEVRELEGARADVELPLLKAQILKQGLTEDEIRSVVDPRSEAVTEVWVRWQFRPHLFYSGPDDLHYMLERTAGRLIFGDGQHGKIPEVGANNILARRYQTGGGLAGNVPVNSITQLLGVTTFVQGVTNPVAAEGGADAETITAVKTRGPQTLRHRGRSLSAADYEALAQAASPGVAIARALSATASNGRPAPGWVTIVIVPHSLEPQPQPSVELRRRVHDYLAIRAPSTVDPGRIAVVGPTYLPIGVEAIIASRDVSEAGAVEERIQLALQRFLHPLSGGPEGCGWPFGRNLYLSDVAALLESVEGVDYVREINLLLRNTPQGEQIVVPPDRNVVAGSIRIEMEAAEAVRGGT